MNSAAPWEPVVRIVGPKDPEGTDPKDGLFTANDEPDQAICDMLKSHGIDADIEQTETLEGYRAAVKRAIRETSNGGILYLDAHGQRTQWAVSSRWDRVALDWRTIAEVGGFPAEKDGREANPLNPLLVVLGMCDAACGQESGSEQLSALEWVATWIADRTVAVGATGVSEGRDTRRIASILHRVATARERPDTAQALSLVQEAMDPRASRGQRAWLTENLRRKWGPPKDSAYTTWVARELSAVSLADIRPRWRRPTHS